MQLVSKMKIETPRLILRDFEMRDLADLHEMLGDAETMQNCEPAFEFEKTEAFLRDFCIGRKAAVAAALRDSGKVIGYILFNSIGAHEVYELGWIFNKNFWRQGYAFEAISALIEHGFSQMGIHKFFAEAIDTEKSVGLMEKLGMKREGIQRAHTKDCKGQWVDMYIYGLLRDDYFDNKTGVF